MTEKLKIVGAYKRYLESFKTINTESQLFENYKKMYNYAFNTVEGELSLLLALDCVEMTLKHIREKQLHFKYSGCEWEKSRNDRFFKFKNAVESADKRGDTEAFKVSFYRMFKCIKEEEAPNMQLYMWSKYRDTTCGFDLLTRGRAIVRELLKASSEEEIDEILSVPEHSELEGVETTVFN